MRERKLYIIPVRHTAWEIDKKNPSEDPEEEAVQLAWQKISNYILGDGSPFKPSGLNIYQDSLPQLGRLNRSRLADGDYLIDQLWREEFMRYSPNMRLVGILHARGAKILPPESLVCLLLYYQCNRLADKHPRIFGGNLFDSFRTCIRDMRDHFIAKRINQTLTPDRIGLAILGADHEIRPHLSKDITTTVPQELFSDAPSDLLDHWLGPNLPRFVLQHQPELTPVRS